MRHCSAELWVVVYTILHRVCPVQREKKQLCGSRRHSNKLSKPSKAVLLIKGCSRLFSMKSVFKNTIVFSITEFQESEQDNISKKTARAKRTY